MRAWHVLAVLALVSAGGGAGAVAQQQCELTSGANARLNQANPNTPQAMTFIGGLVQFNCPDGKVIRADSAVIVDATQQRFLIGHAYYSDAEKTLTSVRMTFFGKEGRLTAEQNVVLTDKTNGSVINGEFLNYTQASRTEPSHAIVYGGRPHAVLRGKGRAATPAPATAPDSAAAGDSTAARDSTRRDTTRARPPAAPGDTAVADTVTTVVDADQMQLMGQDDFRGSGNVKLTRGDVKGSGQQVAYTQSTGHMKLTGNARMEGSNFTLDAGTIDGVMKNNELESVLAVFHARLVADEVHVNAPSITVSFTDGKVQRLVALSAKLAKRTDTEGGAMAEALARDFRLVADSIDALVPEQRMERVTAVGTAYGERTNDSITAKLPKVAAKDWLRGDTIIGVFARPGIPLPSADSAIVAVSLDTARADSAAGGKVADSAAVAKVAGKKQKKGAKTAEAVAAGAAASDTAQSELRAVVAVGATTPASSIYRMTDKKKPATPPSINYLLAKRITLGFQKGDVSRVRAQGDIRGVHLQPQETPTDSTKAVADSIKPRTDSARTPPDSTKGPGAGATAPAVHGRAPAGKAGAPAAGGTGPARKVPVGVVQAAPAPHALVEVPG